MISQQRSGSTYLVEALDAHPDLGCVDEIFAERSGTDTGDWSAVDAKWEDTFSRQCPRGWWAPRAVGFKWMTNQGHDELHAHVLAKAKAPGTRVVFLFRRNELRREVSAAVNLAVGGEARGLAHPATDAAAQLVRARRVRLGHPRDKVSVSWGQAVQQLERGHAAAATTVNALRHQRRARAELPHPPRAPAAAVRCDLDLGDRAGDARGQG